MEYYINDKWDFVKKIETGSSSASFIPIDTENHQYLDFLEWKKLGGIPKVEVIPELKLPTIITRQQGLIWLFMEMGIMEEDILENINAITDAGERYKAKIAFQDNRWYSDDPYVLQMGKGLGLDTPEKLEKAFKGAQKL